MPPATADGRGRRKIEASHEEDEAEEPRGRMNRRSQRFAIAFKGAVMKARP